MAAEIATGALKPAAPSTNAPNENAINSACSRRSLVSPATQSLMISNLPVSTDSLYRKIDAKTIQAIGNMPKAAP